LDTAEATGIEAQLKAEIEELRQEYGISVRRVLYYRLVHGQPQQMQRLTLPREWKTAPD
jgi:hypothetical protein